MLARPLPRVAAWLRLGLAIVMVAVQVGCVPPSATRQGNAPGSDLVDVQRLDDSIELDIRYATPDNFTGTKLYPVARCLLRRPVAERLTRVQQRLRAAGFGLRIWDCYRPFSVQQRFWALKPDPRYVAEPVVRDGRPVEGSKHNRGAAVDLTLVDSEGRLLDMPSGFDDFTQRSHRDFAGSGDNQRRNARRLEAAMVAEGFDPLPTEWWHFDGPGWQEYSILDEPLAE